MTNFSDTVPPLARFSSLIVTVTPGVSPSPVAIPAAAGAGAVAGGGAVGGAVDGSLLAACGVAAGAAGVSRLPQNESRRRTIRQRARRNPNISHLRLKSGIVSHRRL